MSVHSRASSTGGGSTGWFQGVIAGITASPSTPVRGPPSVRRVTPKSTPNSPAHRRQSLSRLPSQLSLDRSIHNESSSINSKNGQKTASQTIIQELKASNASLMAQQATLEAQFMNQLSQAQQNFQEQLEIRTKQQHELQQKCGVLQAYKAGADAQLQETHSQLSQAREESAFQRHSVSDLKSQLYQLERKLELAQKQGQGQLEQQPQKQEQQKQQHKDDRPKREQKNPPDYYRKWQESQNELQAYRRQCSELQPVVQELKSEIVRLEVQVDQKDIIRTNSAEEIKDVKAELELAKKQAASREEYRRDEVEDLRVLHDAQEAEISQMRSELDEARGERELRDLELQETRMQLAETKEQYQQHIISMEKKTQQLQKSNNTAANTDQNLRQLEQLKTQMKARLQKVLNGSSSPRSSSTSVHTGEQRTDEDGDVPQEESMIAEREEKTAMVESSDTEDLIKKAPSDGDSTLLTDLDETLNSSCSQISGAQQEERENQFKLKSSDRSRAPDSTILEEDREESQNESSSKEPTNLILRLERQLEANQTMFQRLGEQMSESRTEHQQQMATLKKTAEKLNHEKLTTSKKLEDFQMRTLTGSKADDSSLSTVRDLSTIASQLRQIIAGESLELYHTECSTIGTNSYYGSDYSSVGSNSDTRSTDISFTQNSI